MQKTLLVRFFLGIAFTLPFYGLSAFAQTSTVSLFGTVTASQVKDGLGFNLNPNEEWQWQAAAAAGATHARFQCSWGTVEQQTAPPENAPAATRYVEDPTCVAGFASAAKYGIHPTVVAAYGPPFHPILNVTVPKGAPAGATTFVVKFTQGFGGDTLRNLKSPYDYICPGTTGCASQVSSRHSYQGTLIASVTPIDATHAQISLASALTEALPAGTAPYLINEILYPSAATESATDSSVVAYGDYVNFLASDMASRGVTGDIEIWNEPPWANDPWDARDELYDSGLYTGSAQSGANFGFAANLMTRSFPSGITATWNGTSGSGETSLLGSRMLEWSGETLVEPSLTITKESFHPYSGHYANPEDSMFVSKCLEGTAAATSLPYINPFSNGMNCYLPGESDSANLMLAVQLDWKEKLVNPAYGISHEITETNELPPAAGMRMQQAKAIMRQFIGFQADGITPIEFFAMYDNNLNDPNFSFVQQVGATSTYTANPQYTAIADFMQDILPISNAPATSYSAANLPSVSSYTGTYGLGTANFVGSREGLQENSVAYLVWQISACTTSTTCWYHVAAPAPAPVAVNVPAGMKVDAVINTVTRASIAYSFSNSTVTFNVSDDPIELLLDPLSYTGTAPSGSSGLVSTTLALSVNPGSSTYGQQVALTAVVMPYTSSSYSTNGASVSFFSGSSLIGTAPLSSGVAMLDTTSLPAGSNVLGASFGGNAGFFASSGEARITVTKATPTITLPAISGTTTTSAPFTVTATASSPASISYKVLSGPARIASTANGSITLAVTGAGTVALQASQLAYGNYAAATAQTSFTVAAAESPNLALSIPPQTYGSAPFSVTATSNSTAPITYTVLNGPAKISGNTLTLTGTGTVSLAATQPLAGNYLAASARTYFTVQGEVPTLSIPGITGKVTTSAPFTVTATSSSPAAMYYKVLSGPARISSTTVSSATLAVTGAGTVALQASQLAYGNYAAATAQTSFTVAAAESPDLALSIPPQTYGSAPFSLTATSNSTAPITYTVLNGPATISGNTVTLTGTGTVTVAATQPLGGNYLAASARTYFTVQGEAATITLPAISGKTTTSAPFTVTATSSSPASISYKVLSGPARIASTANGSITLAVTGAGTVALQASQLAYGNYAAATAQTSFTVQTQ